MAYEPVQAIHPANQGRSFTSKNKLLQLILINIPGPPEQGGGQGGRQPPQSFLSMSPFFEEP